MILEVPSIGSGHPLYKPASTDAVKRLAGRAHLLQRTGMSPRRWNNWLARTTVVATTTMMSTMLGCRDKVPAPHPETSAPAPRAAAPSPHGGAPDWEKAFSHRVHFDAKASSVVVDVQIAPGFHAYTTGETTGRSLQIELAPDGAYALDGPVQYPSGLEKTLPIGKSVIVQGQTQVVAKVSPRKGKAEDPVKGVFRYQVCTDEACDRPRKAPFEVATTP